MDFMDRTASNSISTQVITPDIGELVLRVSAAQGEARTVRLRSRRCTIGAGPSCTLRLKAPGLSAVQCEILRDKNRAEVRSLAPDTLLNECPFSFATLAAADILTMGPLRIEIVQTGLPDEPPAGLRKSSEARQAEERRLEQFTRHLEDLQSRLAIREQEIENRIGQWTERLQCRESAILRESEILSDRESAIRVLCEGLREKRRENEGREKQLDQRLAHRGEMLDGKEGEIREQRERLDREMLENAEAVERFEQLQTEFESRRDEIEQVRVQLETQREELQDQVAQRQETLDAKDQELQRQRAEFEEECRGQITDVEESRQAQEELGARRAEVDRLALQLETKQQELSLDQERFDARRAEQESVIEEAGRLREESIERLEEIERIGEQNDTQRDEIETRRDELRSQWEEMEARRKELESQSQEIDSRREEIDSRSEEIERESAERAAMLDVRDQEQKESQERFDRLKEEQENRAESARRIQDETDARAAEVEQLRTQIDAQREDAQNQWTERSAELEEKELQLRQAQERFEQEQGEREGIEQERAEQKETLGQCQRLEKELNQRQAEIERLRTELDERERDKQERAEQEDTSEQFQRLEEDLNERQAEIERLRTELDSRSQASEAEWAERSAALEEKERKLAESQERIDLKQSEQEEMTQRTGQLQEEWEGRLDELDKLRRQLLESKPIDQDVEQPRVETETETPIENERFHEPDSSQTDLMRADSSPGERSDATPLDMEMEIDDSPDRMHFKADDTFDDESDETDEVPPTETENEDAPIDLKSVFQRLGVESLYDEDTEKNKDSSQRSKLLTESDVGVGMSSDESSDTADFPLTSMVDADSRITTEQGSAYSSTDTEQEDDDESINDYMANLMQRISDKSSQSSFGDTSYQPKGDQKATDDRKVESDAVVDSSDDIDPSQYIPRAVAPEKMHDLSAMREVANISTRQAVSRHSRKNMYLMQRTVMAMAVIAMAFGGALVWLAVINNFNWIFLVAAGGSFLLGLKWTIELIRISRMLAGQAEVEQSEVEQTGDEEPDALSEGRTLNSLNTLNSATTDAAVERSRRPTLEDYIATSAHDGFDSEQMPANPTNFEDVDKTPKQVDP